MTKSYEAAYTVLVSRLATMDGIRAAPTQPQEQQSVFPYLEMDTLTHEWTKITAAGPEGEHTFRWKVHVERGTQGLPKARAELMPFAGRMATKLMYGNYRLEDTVDGFVSLTCDEKPGKVGGVDTLCYDCKLIVKILGQG